MLKIKKPKDTHQVIGAKLIVQIDTTTANVILNGNGEGGDMGDDTTITTTANTNTTTFIRISNDERIGITCIKRPGHSNGTLSAFVNTYQAPALTNCQSYAENRTGQEHYCMQKMFVYTLQSRGYSFYQIVCRFAEPSAHDEAEMLLKRVCKCICELLEIY
jgi:hypothetical protein